MFLPQADAAKLAETIGLQQPGATLADMLARWRPEQHPDVLALIEGMAQALTSDLPAPQAA